MCQKDLKIVEVPITYLARVSGAATKLKPVRDGVRIASTIYLLTRMHNLFFILIYRRASYSWRPCYGIYVVDEWLKNITHVPLTILSTLLIVIGIQMFISLS